MLEHLIHWGWIDVECAISWGNKIECFGVNYAGFCSDSHIFVNFKKSPLDSALVTKRLLY